MAKQTFTTGQILTAAQMTSLQETAMGGGAATAKTTSYVLVAADAGTTVAMNSSGATTITVNTGLFAAGDTVFIQNLGTGVCTITAGSATVNSAGSLALPQYDGGILYFTSASAAIFYDYIQAGMTSPLTTKGDLWTYTTTDARLASSGVNNDVLTVDTSTATGLKWAAPGAASPTWSLLNSGGTTLSGSQTVTVSGISAKKLLILISGASTPSDFSVVQVRVNSISTNDYTQFGVANTPASTVVAANFGASARWTDLAGIYVGRTGNSAADTVSGAVFIDGADSTGWKNYDCFGSGITSGHSQTQFATAGIIEMSAAITSVNIFNADGNFDAGTVYVLGAN